ncbi:MAG: 3-isopropylmalate dehydratase, partial [Acidiferrobacterales bacterium]
MKIHCNRAWVFGDNIDTDVLAPSAYLMKPVEEVAKHCLEAVDPSFAVSVQPGDAFVAGANLGVGSSREGAPQALLLLGIRILLAKSFARIFYRNALNLGLPALVCADTGRIRQGDELRVDPLAGTVENLTTSETLACEPLPAHLMDMIADGGLLPH